MGRQCNHKLRQALKDFFIIRKFLRARLFFGQRQDQIKLTQEAQIGPCDYVWSKHYPVVCDGNKIGPYIFESTERVMRRSEMLNIYDLSGRDFWVKLGSHQKGTASNLEQFVKYILPSISHDFNLITTDGDASVPSDFSDECVNSLLENQFLCRWFTQNADTSHDKIEAIPIGLDFHTNRGSGVGVALRNIFDAVRKSEEVGRIDKVFVDVNLNKSSPLREKIVELIKDDSRFVVLQKRLTQKSLWINYKKYKYVLSLQGNGLDCHRTWEALYLGAIVIADRTSLHPLLSQYPVYQFRNVEDLVSEKLFENISKELVGKGWEITSFEALRRVFRDAKKK